MDSLSSVDRVPSSHPPLTLPTSDSVPDRVLRDRTKRDRHNTSSNPALPPVKRPVKDRWFYEPIPSPLPADVTNIDTVALDPAIPTLLCPRLTWMLDGDSRPDSQADDDWTQANTRLFGSSVDHSVSAMVRDAACPSITLDSVTALASSASSCPVATFDVASAYISADIRSSDSASSSSHLNTKTLRRILAARETIFKYGIYLPRSDHDADISPESARWRSGRQLEWLRLKAVGAFEYDWTISRMTLEHPDYQVADIGRVFFIYDYKFSGEHRVRLVFDGSRQSPHTYKDTYSPTVRAESIRIFHVYSVEMDWDIRQFDVPQAFLQSPIDHTIFVYPPRTHVERPDQILKLRLALYGAKQSSALFYKLLNEFLLGLDFVSSSFDPCWLPWQGTVYTVP
jgi:hypothetical protein